MELTPYTNIARRNTQNGILSARTHLKLYSGELSNSKVEFIFNDTELKNVGTIVIWD